MFYSFRGYPQISFKDSLELDKWLVIKADIVQIGYLDFAFVQTKLNGIAGEGGVVFFSGEPFFLSGGDYFAIAHKAGGRVMVESGDTENIHGGIFCVRTENLKLLIRATTIQKKEQGRLISQIKNAEF